MGPRFLFLEFPGPLSPLSSFFSKDPLLAWNKEVLTSYRRDFFYSCDSFPQLSKGFRPSFFPSGKIPLFFLFFFLLPSPPKYPSVFCCKGRAF